MNARPWLAVGLIAAAASTASAQATPSSQCPGGSLPTDPNRVSQDACQQARDLFQFMAPQVGLALTGGNTILGGGGTLGGPGHFRISIRGNAVAGAVPKVQDLQPRSSGATPARTFQTTAAFIPLPTVDAALGVFKGIPLGLTNVGGVDLLASATYVPDVSASNVELTVSGSKLKIGYGARVGLLQESILVPGVSASWLRRETPMLNLVASAGSSTLSVRDLAVQTDALRLVASKSFLVFGLAAGVGQDRYSSESTISGRYVAGVTQANSAPAPVAQDMSRTNYFVDLSLNLPFIKIVGEVGQATGGTVTTFNQFEGAQASGARTYFSAGITIGF